MSGLLGSVSSIPVPAAAGTAAVSTDPRRGGDTEPSKPGGEIRDPVLREAFEAAFDAWARKYPHLLEDWPA